MKRTSAKTRFLSKDRQKKKKCLQNMKISSRQYYNGGAIGGKMFTRRKTEYCLKKNESVP